MPTPIKFNFCKMDIVYLMAAYATLCGPLFRPPVTSGEMVYYVNTTPTTWYEANKSCTLATPNLEYYYTGIKPDVSLSTLEVNKTRDKVWLGYISTYQLFQYIGCAKLQDFLPITTASNTSIDLASPGRCYSACDNVGYFGITIIPVNQSMCYCFINQLNITNARVSMCNQSCSSPAGTACGGIGFLSLYRPVNNLSIENVADGATRGDCVKYKRIPGLFLWDDCKNSTHPVLCQNLKEEVLSKSTSDQAWLGASLACFNNSLYPLSYETVSTVSHLRESKSWTGMFRSLVVYRYTDYGKKPKEYGFLDITGKGSSVIFSSSATTNYKVLCQAETMISTKPTGLTTLTTGSNQLTTEPTAEISPTSKWTSTAIPIHDKQRPNEESGASTYVGAAAAGILVLIVIVVIVVLVVRRRRQQTAKTTCQGSSLGVVSPDGDNGIVYSEEDYAQANDLGNTSGSCAKANIHAEAAGEANDNRDDVYDTTSTSKANVHSIRSGKKDTENVYNVLNSVEDDTYSHTTPSIRNISGKCSIVSVTLSQNVNDPENVYDRAKVSGNERNDDLHRKQPVIDNTYSHAIFTRNDEDNDSTVYDTTNTRKGDKQDRLTDNVYGKLEH